MDSVNRNLWRETEIEYDRLINKVRLGKKNYLAGRKWLEDHHFITLQPGRGDYAKARFNMGSAVLGRTASSTAPDTAKGKNAVSDEVSDRTAPDTAPGTASDTASDTHINKDVFTINDKTFIERRRTPAGADDDGGDDGNEIIVPDSVEEDRQAAEASRPQTPNPLSPSEEEVRKDLLGSVYHQTYAAERLKLTKAPTDYAELVEAFILQQLAGVEEGKPAFKKDYRKHFLYWMPKWRDVNQNAKPTHGTTNQRTPGALRPTSLGNPDYRGEASTCDVDL
ncbi:hypothetical protein [Tellurirhabdus bombi]|uniref:hypothetical protein n=1 Tax=Tellurirhabdus bombi TaxID=2907205 RepID=UPI001F2E76D9|nr:hypothetical protein [Tellurirhabdus bombi]